MNSWQFLDKLERKWSGLREDWSLLLIHPSIQHTHQNHPLYTLLKSLLIYLSRKKVKKNILPQAEYLVSTVYCSENPDITVEDGSNGIMYSVSEEGTRGARGPRTITAASTGWSTAKKNTEDDFLVTHIFIGHTLNSVIHKEWYFKVDCTEFIYSVFLN